MIQRILCRRLQSNLLLLALLGMFLRSRGVGEVMALGMGLELVVAELALDWGWVLGLVKVLKLR
jgi:hypothetical protein